ncbi:MAG: ComEC/Rec2 family competence protein [Clostridia bacterium]|nr:ComEC/Rec2 family competence protein [Clostridia bacterium]
MKPINLRPLALFCLSFYLFGIILSANTFNKLPFAAALLALSALLFFIFRKTDRNLYVRTAAIIALALCASLCFVAFGIDRPMKQCLTYEGEHQISGKICDVKWTTPYSCGYLAEINEMDGDAVDFKVALEGNDVMKRGDLFRADAVIEQIRSTDEFDSKRYYLSQGAFLSAYTDDLVYTGQDIDFVDKLSFINESLSAKFLIYMGEENGGLAASMFLGNRDYLKDDFYTAVRNLGLAHVIALSGMHLTVICAMLGIFLSNIGARAGRLCTIFIVALYIILTGFFASIVRAGIMLTCYNLLTYSGRSTDQPTNLGISAILIVLFDPFSICDLGFQLSVAAMLGVFATLKIMGGDIAFDDAKTKTIKALILPVAMSFISMAFTMIPVVIYFGYITPAAIIATVPFAWFGDLILWMSPIVLLFGGIPFIGNIICTLCSYPCIAFDRFALMFGSSSRITVEVSEDWHICLAFLFSLTFMLIFVLDSKKARKITLGISMSFLGAFIICSVYLGWKQFNSVISVPICTNSGEAIVVNHRNDCIAVDISNGSSTVYTLISYTARDLKSQDIDCLIITNPHYSHAKYLNKLTNGTKVNTVYMPDEEDSYMVAKEMPEGVEIKYYLQGKEFKTEGFSLSTYEDVYLSRSVVPIIRLKIESNDKDLSYIGAAASEAEILPYESDYIWIGDYGPKYKEPFGLPFAAENVLLSPDAQIFCDHESISPKDGEFILCEP